MEENRQNPQNPTITLLAPTNGSVTPPLQDHIWPKVKHHVANELLSIANPRDYPERSRPRPVTFRWQAATSEPNHARYDLHISRDPDFADAIVLAGLQAPQAKVPDLMVGTRYYWKVVQHREGVPAAESPVETFVTHADPPRWIHVPGISNVRDLGGWAIDERRRVRQGMIYRSAEMNTHIVLPPEGERVLVEQLGIRTDLDLRGTADDEDPAPALDPARVAWKLCPLYAYKDIFTPQGKETILNAFRVLADPARYPLLIHCWAGADRTGTLAFLINGLLGVSLEDLIHDYELTSLSRFGLRLENGEGFQEILQGLSAYGSEGSSLAERIQAYLLDAGLTLEEMQRMRDVLIE